MRLRILPSAFGDLDRGRAFYARHGDELGDYFLDSLFADIDSLADAIYYRVDGDVCTVWRVLDCRRRPSSIRRDLSRSR